jgi:hypothetical protein
MQYKYIKQGQTLYFGSEARKRQPVKCNAEMFHELNLNGFAENPIFLCVSTAEI